MAGFFRKLLRELEPLVHQESERKALLTVRPYLWKNLRWDGVTVDSEGRVTELRLSDSGLFGKVPEALRNLRHLKVLNLSGNELEGEVPEALRNLRHLKVLNLSGNELEGLIPEWLGELEGLEKFSVSNNSFRGELPEALKNLRHLKVLDLRRNMLEGEIPAWLRQLEHLEELYLGSNCFQRRIPRWLIHHEGLRAHDVVDMVKAEKLQAPQRDRDALCALFVEADGPQWRNNSGWNTRADLLSWCGVSVDRRGRVTKLELPANSLSGELPAALGDLEHLRVVNLGGNRLHGTIPKEWSTLECLETLDLENSFSEPCQSDRAQLVAFFEATNGHLWRRKRGWGTNDDLRSWYGVTVDMEGRVAGLELRANNLRGTLPAALAKLHHLQVLNLEHNYIGGTIPQELENLATLNRHLWSNLFHDTRLEELGERSEIYLQTPLKRKDTLRVEDEGFLPGPSRAADMDMKRSLLSRDPLLTTSIESPLSTSAELDRAAVLATFEATNGHNWRNNSRWKTDTDIRCWYGVHVNADGRVDRLELRTNNLTGELPADLGSLDSLQVLDLGINRLRVFPKETAEGLLKLKSLSTINTQQNPWEEPPRAVVEAGLEAIIRYYEAIERSGVRESWMIKVVLVGAVCAGKSSVVASLTAREPRPVPLAKRTRGVDVHVEKPFRPGGSKANLVFWDFAGHDDYHSTHSLFLSDGALFLLVVDLARFVDDHSSRSTAVHIWLDALLCRTPGAVVQIIATHTDELGEEHDVETAVNELRQAVHAHLMAKGAEYERGWNSVVGTGEMPAAPTLRVVDKIHAMSCKTGINWPELGRAIGDLAAQGTTENISPCCTTSDKALGEEDKLFPSVGQKIPTSWARAAAVMDALREGTDPVVAAQLQAPSPLADGARIRFLRWEDAVRMWGDIIERSNFSDESEAGGATEVLEDAVRLKQSEGMFLLDNGLLHLDPTWINELLRAILDHRLQDPAYSGFWERELEAYADGHPRLRFSQLVKAHRTFCASGTLTQSYLQFLWRDVKDMDQEGLFGRLLETMLKHGVVFSGLDCSSMDGRVAVGGESCETLFVPVRLQRYIDEEQLNEFCVPCVHNEWRRQLVVRIWQSYIPPGIIGMFMARLLGIEEVQFHSAWSRGISFMIGGSEVLLYLNAPGVGKSEIEVHVVGPKRSDEVENKVRRMEAAITTLLEENFPGLRFHAESLRSIEGQDALMERIDTLEAHLDVRLDEIEGKLDEAAASSRQSLECLKSLQVANFPYPHLLVVREKTPRSGGGNTAWEGRKKRVLSKTMFKSLCTRVRTVGRKEMRLQFLCPYDFSPVPCGPEGEGYAFGKARDWVQKVFPAVQVTAVIAKVALKTVSGLDLPVSEFLNALKEGVGEEVADRALDEEALRRVLLGEDASPDMQDTSKASYAAVVKIMEKNGYDDFKKEMRLVPDGKGQGGMVWVSNGNVDRWENSHSMAPSA